MGTFGWVLLLGGVGFVGWKVLSAGESFFAITPSRDYEYFGSAEEAFDWAKAKKGTHVYQLSGSEFHGTYSDPDPSARLVMRTNKRRSSKRRKT